MVLKKIGVINLGNEYEDLGVDKISKSVICEDALMGAVYIGDLEVTNPGKFTDNMAPYKLVEHFHADGVGLTETHLLVFKNNTVEYHPIDDLETCEKVVTYDTDAVVEDTNIRWES